MANRQHVQIVRKGTDSIKRWRSTNPGIRLDVSDAELGRVDLREADLRGADFSGADLNKADLAGCLFNGADLRAATLESARLSEADLRNANLRQASLPDAELHAALLDDANLVQANLIRANLSEAHLRRANLSRARLHHADLSRADLVGADLRSASFMGAELVSTNLRDVNLSDSVLSSAVLAHADLSGADLTGASVMGTSFDDVLIKGAKLTGAKVGDTVWVSTDLSGVIGLEQVVHFRPSTIGTNTLAISRGKISEVFLRGCGLSEWEIIAARLHAPELSVEEVQRLLYDISAVRATLPIQIRPLFLSYSHADSDFVDRLDAKLKEKGIRFWRDTHDMKAGRVDKQLARGISLNPTVVLVLSRSSVQSDWVEWEVATARNLEKELKRDVLCPVTLDAFRSESRRRTLGRVITNSR